MVQHDKVLDEEIYRSGFWKQLRRYDNPKGAMELYLNCFSGCEKIEMISGGPRLVAVVAAIPGVTEIIMHDIYPEPLEATKEYIRNPKEFLSDYPQLQAEWVFLHEKELKPNLDHLKICIKEDMPELKDFDGSMAEEVVLHPPSENPDEYLLPIFLEETQKSLRREGRFIFSVYPTSGDNCLLNNFIELAGNVGMDTPDFYDSARKWIHVDKITEYLQNQASDVYEKNKERFWLGDLSRIRLYSQEEITELAKNGFDIIGSYNIPGGMFPFAARLYYVLKKK